MSRKVFGVGINDVPGMQGKYSTRESRWLYSEWQNMLMRCYSESCISKHPTYIGCTVCDEWKRLSNFVKDAKTLPGWTDVVAHNYRGMSLDKDGLIVNNKEYSKYACQWVTIGQNSHERNVRLGCPLKDPNVVNKVNTPEAHMKTAVSRGREVIGIDPQGNIHEWFATQEAARQLEVHNSIIQQTCAGGRNNKGVWECISRTKKYGKLKGWSFYWKDEYFSTFLSKIVDNK